MSLIWPRRARVLTFIVAGFCVWAVKNQNVCASSCKELYGRTFDRLSIIEVDPLQLGEGFTERRLEYVDATGRTRVNGDHRDNYNAARTLLEALSGDSARSAESLLALMNDPRAVTEGWFTTAQREPLTTGQIHYLAMKLEALGGELGILETFHVRLDLYRIFATEKIVDVRRHNHPDQVQIGESARYMDLRFSYGMGEDLVPIITVNVDQRSRLGVQGFVPLSSVIYDPRFRPHLGPEHKPAVSKFTLLFDRIIGSGLTAQPYLPTQFLDPSKIYLGLVFHQSPHVRDYARRGRMAREPFVGEHIWRSVEVLNEAELTYGVRRNRRIAPDRVYNPYNPVGLNHGERAQVLAMGLIMYEMVYGRNLFFGDRLAEISYKSREKRTLEDRLREMEIDTGFFSGHEGWEQKLRMIIYQSLVVPEYSFATMRSHLFALDSGAPIRIQEGYD